MVKLKITLQDILDQEGMSQNHLSKISKVTQSKISNLCNNKLKELNIGIIERIANALNITDISRIMTFEQEKNEAKD